MKPFHLGILILLASANFVSASQFRGEGYEPLTGAFDTFQGDLNVESARVLAAANPKGLVYGMVIEPSVEVINSILAEGLLDVNAFDGYGLCALTYALDKKDFAAADALIANGADVNAFSFSTPLNIEANWRNYEGVKYLLDHGADVHATGKSGRSIFGRGIPELDQLLIDAGHAQK